MIYIDVLVCFKTNLGTLAADVNCTITQRWIAFCLLKIGKQNAVICYVRHGLVVLYSMTYIFRNPYTLQLWIIFQTMHD